MSVLFADLVGFTSRSEQLDVEDVRGTLAPFHAMLRQVLESFGGTVEKFIGDAVMAVFGAPVAHEDDAERAVRAALAIRESIADLGGDLHVRIGVNTGEALVSLGADPNLGEGMVAGDVVNTAARLQSAASVDGVLVGEATFRTAERQIVFEAHAPIDAKGKTEPVVCWTAVEARSLVPIVAREALPFVGRERERRRLVDAFEECRAERTAQMVTVIGVPGIGKSRLVSELGSYIDADAELTTWRHGQVLPYGSGVAFFALTQIVKQECGILDSDDVRVAATKLDIAIAALGLEAADARWVDNQVSPLVGLEAAADGSGQSEAFAGWRLLFEAMAVASPTVIVVDDLQWADDALLDFLDDLVDLVGDVPLLVVATARPELLERRPGWAGGKTNSHTIGLAPLSSEHTTELIDAIIDRTLLPVDIEVLLLERAGGNPLYAQEYVRALVERGAETALPETVQGIVAARLDGLSAGEKGLLQDAAVIGGTGWLGAVCELGERERSETNDLLLRLERKQLLRRTRRSSIAGEVEFSFTHALIREVAYAQLPRSPRAQRHERAAEWLERVATDRGETAELVAHHYGTALELHAALGEDTEALRPAALRALSDAARQAAARHDHRAVIRYIETALPLRPDEAVRAELLVLRAVSHYYAGEAGESHILESVLLEARDAAIATERTEDAVRVSTLLAMWADNYAADSERVDTYGAEALRLAAGLAPGPITMLPAAHAAFRLLVTGALEEAIALTDREIARAIEARSEVAIALLLVWRGSARAESGDIEGLSDMREAARILDEHAHPSSSSAAYNLGVMLLGLGQLNDAADAFEAAAAAARRSGALGAGTLSGVALAMIAFHRDDTAIAFGLLERPVTATESHESESSNVRGRLLLDDVPAEAAEAARRHVAYGRRSGSVEAQCEGLALIARAELAGGDQVAVTRVLDEYLEAWSRLGGSVACAPSLVEAGLVLVACDRHRELSAAADLVRIANPWTDAARALAECRYTDAAAILDTIPSIPLRDAAVRLAGR